MNLYNFSGDKDGVKIGLTRMSGRTFVKEILYLDAVVRPKPFIWHAELLVVTRYSSFKALEEITASPSSSVASIFYCLWVMVSISPSFRREQRKSSTMSPKLHRWTHSIARSDHGS